MQKRKNCLSVGLLVLLMAATGVLLLRDQPLSRLAGILGRIHGGFVALALLLMLAFWAVWVMPCPTAAAWATPSWASISAPSPPPPPGDSPPRSTICQKTTSPPPTGP